MTRTKRRWVMALTAAGLLTAGCGGSGPAAGPGGEALVEARPDDGGEPVPDAAVVDAAAGPDEPVATEPAEPQSLSAEQAEALELAFQEGELELDRQGAAPELAHRAGAPMIDGQVLSSEWPSSAARTVYFRSQAGLMKATFLVANDAVYLYIGLIVSWRAGTDSYAVVWIDGDNDGRYEGRSSSPYYDVGYSQAAPNGWSGYSYYQSGDRPVTMAPGTANASSSVGSQVHYEYRVGLSDLGTVPGRPIRIMLQYGTDGTARGSYRYPISAEMGSTADWLRRTLATETAPSAPPVTPTQLTPTAGETIALDRPVTWSATGADRYEHLAVCYQSDGRTTVRTGSTTGHPAWWPTGGWPAGECYWKLRGWSGTKASEWSPYRGFVAKELPPDAPALQSPSNGATNQSSAVSLQWSSNGQSSYECELATNSSFTTGRQALTANSLSISVDSLRSGQRYYWRVRSKGASPSPWSATWSFTTRAATIAAPGITGQGPSCLRRQRGHRVVTARSSSGKPSLAISTSFRCPQQQLSPSPTSRASRSRSVTGAPMAAPRRSAAQVVTIGAFAGYAAPRPALGHPRVGFRLGDRAISRRSARSGQGAGTKQKGG